MVEKYVPPQFKLDGFNCPHCVAYAHQKWYDGIANYPIRNANTGFSWLDLSVSICDKCHSFSLWKDEQLIFPQTYIAPLPAVNMPEDVEEDYEEARSIFSQSPRGAAALLRLAIQKLVITLGESGDNLSESIGNLVKKGLSERIKKALDVVRVVGNNAVHPGLIDVKDNPETALNLFKLVNLIVEHMITQPKEVDELFEALPEGAKDAIARRDKKNQP